MRRLGISVVSLFEDEYLRATNQNVSIAEERGFLGMLGCIDCMH
jgi:hypothetical protein